MPERSSYVQGTPCWVDLSATDPAAAKTYYTALFGWDFEDMPTPGGGVYSMARVRGNYVSAVGGQPPGVPAGTPSMWNTYLATDDAAAATAKVAGAGGQVLMGPEDVGDAGRMSFVSDPTGAVVGLWQAGQHIGATLVGDAGAVVWNELITPDPDKALAFYAAVLGLGSSVADMPGGPTYTLLQVGDDQVGGCTTPQMPQVPTHWHVYFATDDTDATVEASNAAGGSVMAEPFDIPTVGRMAVLSDPTGAVFSVMTPTPAQP
ncbi:VOC family protein [Rhodococcus spelaei]|uniref:VOC family protein n=1 Tax=Rhodococcus spelaei TaxID=2546320 RepID=A0A541B9V8_9NOCA|nr:VOC family protein [Rhodococcus spelaei]TQF69053.1 VOC family protein [Rhodococcus spelaei]